MTTAILLSTYNGARYLSAQLDSLAAQNEPEWHLFWRDDASTDDTKQQLIDWLANTGRPATQLAHPVGRLGVRASFLALLGAALADRRFDAFAFADQDDVWLPYKLARARAHLGLGHGHQSGPEEQSGLEAMLYCGRLFLVDAGLRPLAPSAPVRRPPGFPDALTQNIATGCTIVLNRTAAARVASSTPPAAPGVLHDWWSYLLIAATGGQILFDDAPLVLYRQHGANTVGAPSHRRGRALAALRRGPSVFMHALRANVAALRTHTPLLTPEAARQLERIAAALNAGPLARATLLRQVPLHRQTRSEDALFRLWFILG